MITTSNLRAAFVEFANTDEAKLTLGIERAYATISRYVTSTTIGVRATQAVDNVALTLARAYIIDTKALGDEHPVVRDLKEALGWLSMIANGKAFLPADATIEAEAVGTIGTGASICVNTTSKVFNNNLMALMP